MLSLGSSGSRMKKTPRPTPLGSPEGSRAIPIRYAHAHPLEKKPGRDWLHHDFRLGLGGLPEPQGSRSTTTHRPGPWLLPHQRRQPRPRHKKTRPELLRPRGSPTLPLGHGIAGYFSDMVTRQGHARGVTQEDKASQRPPGARRPPGPHVSP